MRKRDPIRTLPPMTATLIGYARCSTDRQDLAAQRQALLELGVAEDRIYTDHGLTGTTRARPGLDQALAAVREGDTVIGGDKVYRSWLLCPAWVRSSPNPVKSCTACG